MTERTVRIVPDAGVPEGGHAIIHIDGVWLLPEPATFRIEPLDETVSSEKLSGWPNGERKPRNVRTTSRGIELLIGPDIVDAPDLLPGTAISLSVPAADVHAEVRWPDLPVSRPVGRGKVVLQHAKSSVLSTDGPLGPNGRTVPAANSNGAGPTVTTVVHSRAQPPRNTNGLSELQRPHQPAANTDRPPVKNDHGTPIAAAQRTAASAAGSSRSSTSPMWPLVIGLVITGLLMALMAPQLQQEISALRAAKEPTALKGAFDINVSSIFEVGETSPLGASSQGIDGQEALRVANQFLHGVDREVDKTEGAFWLRKAIARQLSDRKTTWALTQLGSIYAAPAVGAADYQSARLLWEMAAANGDPVASCFVGQLHEYGLGVAVDLKKAKQSYERAQRLGGCPGLDSALARVGGK